MNTKEINVTGPDKSVPENGIDSVMLSPTLLTALYADVLVPLQISPGGPARRPSKAGTGDSIPVLPVFRAEPADSPARDVAEPARPEVPVLRASAAAGEIPFLGGNRRHICLMVSVPGKDILPAKTKTFLEKMLAACQLSFDDLAIVNLRQSAVTAEALAIRFAPEKWLLAGIAPAAVGMDAAERPFEVVSWNGSELLCFPALAGMEQDSVAARQLKRQLWAGLQKLFGL